MDFFNWLRVVVLGVIEGVTEWMPISSTGHLILLNSLWKGDPTVFTTDFITLFDVVIQLGAVLSVVTLFFRKLYPYAAGKSKEEQVQTWQLWLKVAIACIPPVIFGLFLDDWMDEHLYHYAIVSAMLVLYGILFIVVENRMKDKSAQVRRLRDLDYKTAFLIGWIQCLALVPGTSRSGVTILGALLLGCSRYIASEFTFFLAIPVMFGASCLKLFKYFFIKQLAISGTQAIACVVAMLVSYIVSIFVIRFLINYVKKNNFKPFGVYRIILGVLVLIIFLCFRLEGQA